MSARIGLAGVLVMLGACGGQEQIQPAENLIQLPAKDVALAGPTDVFAVGAEDGPEAQSFSHVSHLAFDDDDNLYVLDRGAGKVYVYDRTGKFIRAMGSKGKGPGELSFPLQMAVTSEGVVVVSDLTRRSFSMFQRDGRYVEELPYEYRRALGGMEMRPHPQAGFVSVYQPHPELKADTGSLRLVWHSLNIDDEPRVLAEVRASRDRMGAGTARVDQPAFSHGFYWGVLPTGQTAVAHTADYRIDIFSPDGTLERTIQRPIEPRTPTAADRQAERERRMGHLIEDAAAATPQMRAAAEKQMKGLKFAEVMPVIEEFGVDRAGRIWVRRGTGGDQKGGGIVDVIAADGTYLGTFPGARTPVAYSPGGLAAYMEEDENEVKRVVVRRVPASWGALASR
jgi:hypothetical protein